MSKVCAKGKRKYRSMQHNVGYAPHINWERQSKTYTEEIDNKIYEAQQEYKKSLSFWSRLKRWFKKWFN